MFSVLPLETQWPCKHPRIRAFTGVELLGQRVGFDFSGTFPSLQRVSQLQHVGRLPAFSSLPLTGNRCLKLNLCSAGFLFVARLSLSLPPRSGHVDG